MIEISPLWNPKTSFHISLKATFKSDQAPCCHSKPQQLEIHFQWSTSVSSKSSKQKWQSFLTSHCWQDPLFFLFYLDSSIGGGIDESPFGAVSWERHRGTPWWQTMGTKLVKWQRGVIDRYESDALARRRHPATRFGRSSPNPTSKTPRNPRHSNGN